MNLNHKIITSILLGVILGSSSALVILKHSQNRKPHARLRSKHKLVAKPTPTPSDFCLTTPVIFYHHVHPLEDAEKKGYKALSVDPYNFESHIRYLLNKGYTIIPLAEAVDNLIKRKTPTNKPLVITLDDGYKDNYQYAFPIAKKYKIPINIGLISSFISRKEDHLTWKEILEMQKSGYVHFFNHSLSHRSLGIDDEKVVSDQIMFAQENIDKQLGPQPRIMIYPYGKYADVAENVLRKNHFLAAFDVKIGAELCQSKIYELPRFRMGNGGPSVYNL